MMDKTINEIKRLNGNKENLDEIARYEDAYESYHADIKISYNKGKAEGIAEEKLETAKRLIASNTSIDIIRIATGLSIEEINKLK
jgi:predicted transposase/invertase (TIGR01784 family)